MPEMTEPASVILVGDDGRTDTEPALLAERVTSAYGFHRPWWRGVSLFHRDGGRYEVVSAQPARALPPLSRLLAATIYNPRLAVRYEYRRIGPYDLGVLKEALLRAIDKDDDILTQFHDADHLKRRLAHATSFDDVAEVLRFAATETDSA
jgi:hypothetical protein